MKNYTTGFFNFRYSSKINKNLIISDYKNTPMKATQGIYEQIGTDGYMRALCENLIEEKVSQIL